MNAHLLGSIVNKQWGAIIRFGIWDIFVIVKSMQTILKFDTGNERKKERKRRTNDASRWLSLIKEQTRSNVCLFDVPKNSSFLKKKMRRETSRERWERRQWKNKTKQKIRLVRVCTKPKVKSKRDFLCRPSTIESWKKRQKRSDFGLIRAKPNEKNLHSSWN